MKETLATLIGFAVAAVLPAAMLALSSPGLGGGIHADVVTLPGLTALGYIYSIVFTIVFGGSLFLALRRYHLVRWWSALIAGFLIGVIVIFIVFPSAGFMQRDSLRILLIFGATGSLSGIVFWAIWRSGTRTSMKT